MNTAPTKPRILVMANQKGGVGKTTTAINLGTALAANGENVLIVDMDPQGNASTGLGIDRSQRAASSYDLLMQSCDLDDAIVSTHVPRVSVVPSTLDLLGFEMEVSKREDRTFRLKKALRQVGEQVLAQGPFSYILIDCPPSLNLLTINALAAADAIVVPLQCEFFALEGLSQLLQTIEQIKTTLNPDLYIQGVVMTMYDKRNNLSQQVLDDVRDHLGELIYSTVIPRNVRLSEAPSYGKPALLYDLNCPGSQAYLKLALEVIEREKHYLAA